MIIFFEVLKGLFFLCTVLFGLFYIKGKSFFDPQIFDTITKIFMPGYLVLCGIIIGYFVISFFTAKYKDDKLTLNKIYSRGFIFGLLLGIIMAIFHIYYK